MPVIVACLPPGRQAHSNRVQIDSPSMDLAFIRTSIEWSLYSRFPDGAQHRADEAEGGPRVGFARTRHQRWQRKKSPEGGEDGICWRKDRVSLNLAPASYLSGSGGTPPMQASDRGRRSEPGGEVDVGADLERPFPGRLDQGRSGRPTSCRCHRRCGPESQDEGRVNAIPYAAIVTSKLFSLTFAVPEGWIGFEEDGNRILNRT